jgi:dCTP deaminase
MILSGDEIRERLGTEILIDPFDESNLNPNSYNMTLHDEIMIYEEVVLDMRYPNRVRRIQIPEDGIVLNPNQLYLGRTVEYTETHNLVPEMFAVQPVKIYPGVQICQLFFHEIRGKIKEYCSEKYQNARDIQPSLLYRELNPDAKEDDPQLVFEFGRDRS